MRGTVSKRLRREIGGQEIAEHRKYIARTPGKKSHNLVVMLHSSMSRVAYQMDKREWRSRAE